MITVTPSFSAAQQADSALYTKVVNLVLGNYASAGAGATAASNGDDGSGNYPAAGAIDGDRTEINIGAASAADNGVGKSSWKAASNPSGGSPNILTVSFGQSRTINRVKLYNLAANPSTSYVMEYSVDGSTGWTAFAGTLDQFTPPSPGSGYGWGTPGGWGMGPWGGSTSPYNVTGGLDTFDIPSFTAKAIRIRVFATKTGGPAQVVEIEAYRLVDISSRVLGIKLDRRKDFKLSQAIATQLTLDLDNKDQFFSIFYSPTSAQSATYVNAELKTLGVNVEVNEGFVTFNGQEVIRTFTGSIDTITNNVKPGQAQIVARDFMKHLINQYDSCNLKTSIDITACIQYLLNRNNISNYEQTLFTTTIVLDYFFVYEQPILTTIQQLVQAAGDALFFFDESGIATFQYYLGAAPKSHIDSVTADYDAGLKQNVSSASNTITASWAQTGNWTVGSSPAGHTTLSTDAGGGTLQSPAFLNTGASGIWQVTMYPTSGYMFFDFLINAGVGGSHYIGIQVTSTQTNLVYHFGNTILSTLITVNRTPSPTDIYKVSFDTSGNSILYVNGVQIGTGTWNVGVNPVGGILSLSTTAAGTYSQIGFTQLDGTGQTWPYDPVFFSQTIDMGAGVTQLGALVAVVNLPGGTALNFYTATSSDGSTWDPWVSVANGGQITSAVKRYIKYMILLTVPSSAGGGSTPTVYNVTVNWGTGTGQQKWSSTVNFNLTTLVGIKDLQAQVSDALGGSTAIINDVAVTSSPLILPSGTSTVWQGTAGTPATAISSGNPLILSVGTYTYNITVSGGADTSQMSGTNPAAVVIAYSGAGATVTCTITYIHPTKPVLQLVVSGGAATITDLRLVCKAFTNITTPYQALASDSASIQRHRRRRSDVNNNYIINSGTAGLIATRTISNFKQPVVWLPRVDCWPPVLNVQPGDQANVTEPQSGVSQPFYVSGFTRTISVRGDKAAVAQQFALLPLISS